MQNDLKIKARQCLVAMEWDWECLDGAQQRHWSAQIKDVLRSVAGPADGHALLTPPPRKPGEAMGAEPWFFADAAAGRRAEAVFTGDDAARLNRSAAVHCPCVPREGCIPDLAAVRVATEECPDCGGTGECNCITCRGKCTLCYGTGKTYFAKKQPIPGPVALDDAPPDDPTLELPSAEVLADAVEKHRAALAEMESVGAEFDQPKCGECDGKGFVVVQGNLTGVLASCLDCSGSGLAPPAEHQPRPLKTQADREASEEAGIRIRAENAAAKRARIARRQQDGKAAVEIGGEG